MDERSAYINRYNVPDWDGTLLLVRHGQSQVMADGIVGGPKGCTGLTELGRSQVRALRDRFAAGYEPKVDVVYSSPLPRARETTEIVAEALGEAGSNILTHEGLEELRLSPADGLSWEEARERFEWHSPDVDPHLPYFKGAESRAGFRQRVAATLIEIVERHPDSVIFVGCHGGVVAAAMAAALGVDATHHGVATFTTLTSITQIDIHQHNSAPRWVCVRYNDSAHLDTEELGLASARDPLVGSADRRGKRQETT